MILRLRLHGAAAKSDRKSLTEFVRNALRSPDEKIEYEEVVDEVPSADNLPERSMDTDEE